MHFASMSLDGTASFQPEPLQLCTSPETTPSSSASQHRLPGHLPTPGKGIPHLTAQVQNNWDNLFDFMKHQEKAVNELTQEQKTATSHHGKQLGDLTAKMEANQQQILTTLTAAKADSADSDQLVKAMKVMISQEMKKMECTLISEVHFMVDQLQVELQRDLRATQKNLQKDHEQLSTECNQCIIQIDKLITQVNELQTNIEEVKRQEKEMADNQRKGVQSPLENFPECPPIPAGKSDHLKLTFPTFGRPSDDADPLLYLTRCQDFLALHPLAKTDLLATFCSVLHGTARDWWEVARSSVTTWNEFETVFLSAFLSKDYEDELAARVCTRYQGERIHQRFRLYIPCSL